MLIKFDPELEPGRQEERLIYGSPRFRDWILNDVPALESTWRIELTPQEQFDGLADVFCGGETLTFQWQFRPLRHIRHGVWELKTADLRIFGWFYKKDIFVAWIGDTKDRIKLVGLVPGYVSETVRFRNQLDLDEPKFVSGDNPHDVVSDFDYP